MKRTGSSAVYPPVASLATDSLRRKITGEWTYLRRRVTPQSTPRLHNQNIANPAHGGVRGDAPVSGSHAQARLNVYVQPLHSGRDVEAVPQPTQSADTLVSATSTHTYEPDALCTCAMGTANVSDNRVDVKRLITG